MTGGPATSGQAIRVLIADDQRVVRDGLGMIVDLMEGVEVVGMAGDGAEAMAAVAELAADVVLMDLRMPGTGGVEATRAIRAAGGAAVVVLTTYVDDDSLFPALQAGAAGYLTKDASAEQIEAAIRAVSAGGTWLDPVVQRRLLDAVASQELASALPSGDGAAAGSTAAHGAAASSTGAPGAAASFPDGLTAREVEVLTLVAEGLSNDEIAKRLFLGRATVKTHVNRIFAKTRARDRAQAVSYAYRNGLAGPGA